MARNCVDAFDDKLKPRRSRDAVASFFGRPGEAHPDLSATTLDHRGAARELFIRGKHDSVGEEREAELAVDNVLGEIDRPGDEERLASQDGYPSPWSEHVPDIIDDVS